MTSCFHRRPGIGPPRKQLPGPPNARLSYVVPRSAYWLSLTFLDPSAIAGLILRGRRGWPARPCQNADVILSANVILRGRSCVGFRLDRKQSSIGERCCPSVAGYPTAESTRSTL